jgi:hypothetical protein
LGLRLKDDFDGLKIDPDSILQGGGGTVPPWAYGSPRININLSNVKGSSGSPGHFKGKFLAIIGGGGSVKILCIFIRTVRVGVAGTVVIQQSVCLGKAYQ